MKEREMVGGCCVCSDESGWAENPLVYCDGAGCSVAVHKACYGITNVPSGPWFCRKCESQERAARVRCELCPSKDGALKRTDNGGWAHIVCALYIPEVRFGNVTTMEPIVLLMVPHDRYSKQCYLCEEQGKESKAALGACMQCNKLNCKNYFHVTCAQAAGLLCEEQGANGDNVKYCGYCSHHYNKLKKDGTFTNIKPIPAFRPIRNVESTPESSPDKDKATAPSSSSASGSSNNSSFSKDVSSNLFGHHHQHDRTSSSSDHRGKTASERDAPFSETIKQPPKKKNHSKSSSPASGGLLSPGHRTGSLSTSTSPKSTTLWETSSITKSAASMAAAAAATGDQSHKPPKLKTKIEPESLFRSSAQIEVSGAVKSREMSHIHHRDHEGSSSHTKSNSSDKKKRKLSTNSSSTSHSPQSFRNSSHSPSSSSTSSTTTAAGSSSASSSKEPSPLLESALNEPPAYHGAVKIEKARTNEGEGTTTKKVKEKISKESSQTISSGETVVKKAKKVPSSAKEKESSSKSDKKEKSTKSSGSSSERIGGLGSVLISDRGTSVVTSKTISDGSEKSASSSSKKLKKRKSEDDQKLTTKTTAANVLPVEEPQPQKQRERDRVRENPSPSRMSSSSLLNGSSTPSLSSSSSSPGAMGAPAPAAQQRVPAARLVKSACISGNGPKTVSSGSDILIAKVHSASKSHLLTNGYSTTSGPADAPSASPATPPAPPMAVGDGPMMGSGGPSGHTIDLGAQQHGPPHMSSSFMSMKAPSARPPPASARSVPAREPTDPPPHSLEELLERQWAQGTQFVMNQAQHFDIASLLSCLSQLRQENVRLEERCRHLVSRREHLVAVNARLSLPLNGSLAAALQNAPAAPAVATFLAPSVTMAMGMASQLGVPVSSSPSLLAQQQAALANHDGSGKVHSSSSSSSTMQQLLTNGSGGRGGGGHSFPGMMADLPHFQPGVFASMTPFGLPPMLGQHGGNSGGATNVHHTNMAGGPLPCQSPSSSNSSFSSSGAAAAGNSFVGLLGNSSSGTSGSSAMSGGGGGGGGGHGGRGPESGGKR